VNPLPKFLLLLPINSLLAAACSFAQPAITTPSPTRSVVVSPSVSPAPTTAPPRPTRTLSRPLPTSTPALTPTVPRNTIVERGQLPPGFSLTVYAEVPGPTSLAFGPDGRLYVASTYSAVYAFADHDGDHRAEERQTYATGVNIPLGLAWVSDRLYISYNGNVAAMADKNADGQGDRLISILTGLPADGRHQNDGLALGLDGYLYLGMGSTCDVCRERDPRSAVILRFQPDG